MKIPFLLLEDSLKLGIEIPYVWEPAKVPHALIVGNTGTGKTYCSKLLLGKICIYAPNCELFICDFKGDDDFGYCVGFSNFFRFEDCFRGFDIFYQRFLARQQQKDISRHPLFLFFDEWASALNHVDKKEREELIKKLSSLLMLGRSFSVFLIFSLQRPDSEYFQKVRDNFSLAIGLGNMSEEGKEMVFRSFKKEILPDRTRGTGYLLESGAKLYRIVVPTITNMDILHYTILKHMTSKTDGVRVLE